MHRPRSVLLLAVAIIGTACSSATSSTAGHATNAAPTTAGAQAGTGSAACPGLPKPIRDHGTATATGTSVTLAAGDFFFSPTCERRVPVSSTVTLTVHNGGQALHNVSFPDQDIDTDVPPGQTVIVHVKVGAAGIYAFFCKYHRTSGMAGALVAGRS